MEKKKINKTEFKADDPYIYFNNCTKSKDNIYALTKYFIKYNLLAEFILEQTIKNIKKFKKEQDQLKNDFIKEL